MSDTGSSRRRVTRRDFLKRSAQTSLAASLFANWGCSSQAPLKDKTSVLLLSLDTTRADHLPFHGYPRNTAPILQSLASVSQVFTNAISTSSWTLPAHASMFTGKFVTSHGARKQSSGALTLDDAFDKSGLWDHYRATTVRDDEVLLAEILRDAGYATGAVVAGPWLKKVFGLHRGFEYHDDDDILGLEGSQKRVGNEVTSRAVKWLNGLNGKPFFLFLNYFDPHRPYALPWTFERPFDSTPNPGLHEEDPTVYDHEILFMDWCLEVLFQNMSRLGILDNTLIVALGDHGELFGEHGLTGHGETLYQGEVHVPFFVRYPNGELAPAIREEYVQPVDVVPLILNRLNLPVPSGVQGSPLERISHPILAEVYPIETPKSLGHWQMLIEDGTKLLYNSKGKHELYDLKTDPREARNLAQEQPARFADMTAKLLTHLEALPRPAGTPSPVVIDEQTRQELEAMGYL